MKLLFTNRSLPLVVSVTLATVTLPALLAESHCPAGIASVTPRFVQRALIVIPVRINQKGPFDFMVDTGSRSQPGDRTGRTPYPHNNSYIHHEFRGHPVCCPRNLHRHNQTEPSGASRVLIPWK